MPTGEEVGDTLTNLQTRLKQFQDQLLRLNVGLQLQANGASASSTGAKQTIQFRMYFDSGCLQLYLC